MPILLNDNLDISAPRPTDNRFGPFANTQAALVGVPSAQRYIGLTVGVFDANNEVQEYWFDGGTSNNDLILKSSSLISVGRSTVPLTLNSNVTVSKDITVEGNLFVLGNTTTINVETLVVDDSLIKLAANNTSDSLDIGFYGVYNSNQKSGLYRDASDSGKFKLFKDYQGDLTSNIIIGTTNTATLVANLEAPLINITTANIANLVVQTSAFNSINIVSALRLLSNSVITIDGNTGAPGQVLTSNGTAINWSTKYYYGDSPPDFDTINYGDIFFYIDTPNNFTRMYMWVTDGSSEFFYDFLPPTF